MAAPSPRPIVFLDAGRFYMTPTPGTPQSFEGDVLSAAAVPAAGDENTVVTLDGLPHTRRGPTTWTLDLTIQQNWSPSGISTFLWNHRGEQVNWGASVFMAPAAPDAPLMYGICFVEPGAYGGQQGEWISHDLSLVIVGEPLFATSPSLLEAFEAPPVDYRIRSWVMNDSGVAVPESAE